LGLNFDTVTHKKEGAVKVKRILLIFTALMLVASFSYGQQMPDSTKNWHFRISPYFWFIGLQGTIYRPPAPTLTPEPPPPEHEIDIGFKELSSSIKYAMMLAGEFRTKNTTTIFNYSGLILEGDVVTPLDLIFQNVRIRLNYQAGDLSTGYRFVKSDKWEVDGLVGVKFIYFGIEGKTDLVGNIPFEGNRSKFLAAPIIGARIIYSPIRKLEIMTYGDIGGFLDETENNNQFIGAATYFFTDTFFSSIGYRYWHLEVDKSEAIYDGVVKGWLVRIGFQF
jgi:hypothetical protein